MHTWQYSEDHIVPVFEPRALACKACIPTNWVIFLTPMWPIFGDKVKQLSFTKLFQYRLVLTSTSCGFLQGFVKNVGFFELYSLHLHFIHILYWTQGDGGSSHLWTLGRKNRKDVTYKSFSSFWSGISSPAGKIFFV